MKQLNKKSINSLRFMAAGYINQCCAISATSYRVDVMGKKF